MKTCLNCDTPLSGKFCANCGQKASTQKITWLSFLEELPRSLFNLEKGFWYTVKHFSLHTRAALAGYLSGKRVQFFKPIQYALLGITLYTLLQEFHPMNMPEMEKLDQDDELYNAGYSMGKMLRGNLKFFWLAGVVLYAVPAKILFGKYNFTEHMVISAYIIGHSSFLATVSLLFYSLPIMFNPVVYILIGIMYFRLFKDPVNPLGTLGVVIAHLLACILLFFLMPFVFQYVSQIF